MVHWEIWYDLFNTLFKFNIPMASTHLFLDGIHFTIVNGILMII